MQPQSPHRPEQNIAVAVLFVLAAFCAPSGHRNSGLCHCSRFNSGGRIDASGNRIAQIQWREFSEAAPVFITILATPLTFSIATGLSLGLIAYTVVKVAAGKFREINILVWILTVLFVLRYVYLAVA